MEFINKCNQITFSPIYSDFENNAWNGHDTKYHGYDYDHLPKEVKKNLIIEQNFLCCYCMGQLENDRTTTLEHVFPQNPKGEDIPSNYNIQCIDCRNFDKYTRVVPNAGLSNLPHDISYYNLVASCNSHSSCNNARGNTSIVPFFFNTNVKNEFNYDINGEIFSSKYINEITILGLSDPDLIKYRKFWRKIKNRNITLPFDREDELKKILTTHALEIGIQEDDEFFIQFIEENEFKLKKAIKYKYFYT